MRTFFLASIFLLWLGPGSASAQLITFHLAYEDKDSADHTVSGTAIPQNPGIMVEMIRLIETRVPNLRITFSRKPWARCLAELESGDVDAIFSSSFKPERMKIGVYPMKDERLLRADQPPIP